MISISKLNHTQFNELKYRVLDAINKNDAAVIRAIELLYSMQTSEERSLAKTKHDNGIGFNCKDAKILSSFALQIKEWSEGRSIYSSPLSKRQLNEARRRVQKYWRQLVLFAVAKKQGQIILPLP